MSAVRAKAFTKTRACPSSEDISSRRSPRSKSDNIARHIAGCEFCAAEQSFLSAYSQTTEEYESAEMPAHLRRLSKALLIAKLKILIGTEIRKGILSYEDRVSHLNYSFVPGM